ILEFKDVFLSESDIIGKQDGAYPVLTDIIDQATAGLCAEMVGGMSASLEMTVRHLSERVQFGKPIGSFQALQHKASDMFIQKELASSAVYYAVASIDEKIQGSALAVSTAKAKCAAAYLEVTKTAIQLFGAMGFTNEADIGFFLKRAKVTEVLFGDADHHLDRVATLKGY
ncbi:MAG: acyl-CoA dehydrogenase, partial [Syntrophales bacterium]|nr:acyl-CoA dehydrogenase [Syntrophales bacterium]